MGGERGWEEKEGTPSVVFAGNVERRLSRGFYGKCPMCLLRFGSNRHTRKNEPINILDSSGEAPAHSRDRYCGASTWGERGWRGFTE